MFSGNFSDVTEAGIVFVARIIFHQLTMYY